MRATRAYIASAGTAAVMLGAAVAMFLVVSALVAFGSWPGEESGRQVDEVLLKEVAAAKAETVAVGAQAVKVTRRAAAKQRVTVARAERKAGSRPGARKRDDNAVARTPQGTSSPTAGAGMPIAAVPTPAAGVRQQTQNLTQDVANNLGTTTNQVTNQVQNTVDQTTTQVNQVVDQVVGDVQQQTQTAVQQVQNTVDTTTDAVKNAAGGLLGP